MGSMPRRGVAPDSLQLWAITAASLLQLGRAEEARPYIGCMTDDRPDLTVGRFGRNLRWRRERDMEHYFEGLRKAGLPE